MKVAFIVPTKELEYYHTNYHLILPHIAEKDEAYRDFYKSVPGYKILDNGIAEGVSYPHRKLLDLGRVLGVDEIVIPDVMQQPVATQEAAKQFAKTARPYFGEFKFMAVLQGDTDSSLMRQLYWYEEQPWIDTIALPRVMNKRVRFGRVQFLDLQAHNMLRRFEAIHCLGASNWTKEPLLLSEYPVRGMDTSFPMVMSLANKSIAHNKYFSRRQLEQARRADYFDMVLHPSQRAVAEHNHQVYMDWCNAVE